MLVIYFYPSLSLVHHLVEMTISWCLPSFAGVHPGAQLHHPARHRHLLLHDLPACGEALPPHVLPGPYPSRFLLLTHLRRPRHEDQPHRAHPGGKQEEDHHAQATLHERLCPGGHHVHYHWHRVCHYHRDADP